jgi:uncharacterized protein
MAPSQEQLDDLIRRIVGTAHPLRIILFGSAARGEMGAESDLDVLVVVPDGTHRRDTAATLYAQMRGFGRAVDFIVATPSDLARHGSAHGYVFRPALREGREIYAA